jgi:nucleotide-binding universal stress UspA family protein
MDGVVVGVDESDYARAALRWAFDHGASTSQPVTAVMAWGYIDQHHLERGVPFDPHYSADTASNALDDLVARALGSPDAVVRRAVCDLPARALIEASATASLVVVGSRGVGGFHGLLLGSVSRRVLHGAACPVAVIRDAAGRQGEPVIVGIDGSASSQRALAWAVEYASARQLHLVVLYARRLSHDVITRDATPRARQTVAVEAERFVAGELARVDTGGLLEPPECRTIDERASAALVEASALASIVVVGARGHGGLGSMLLGSVSDQLTQHANSPVVVVP